MTTVWVYKFDGTTQCDADAREIPIEKMREELAVLIGAANILALRKDQRPMVQLCGMPTGRINCYEITDAGWALLSSGIVGMDRFQRLDEGRAESSEQVNLGRIIGSLTASNPRTIQELVGHPLRVYKTGDMLTSGLASEPMQYRSKRCEGNR